MATTDEDTITYNFEGTITDHDYNGDYSADVYSCSVCAALVRELGKETHTNYHLGVSE
jgi:hypothetical protein